MNGFVIKEISIPHAKESGYGLFLDDDFLVLDDVRKLPLSNEPQQMGCLMLALCLNGKARYSVNTVEHTVKKNDFMIISDKQVIDDYLLSPDCNGIAFMISNNFFNEIIKGMPNVASLFLFSRNHPVCHPKEDEVETVLKYIELICEKLNNKSHKFRHEAIRSLITTMIIDLSNFIYRMQENNNIGQTRNEAIFTSFMELVEQNFRTERRVGWYARKMCITSKRLTEAVKDVSSKLPKDWINNYVTLEIRMLLKNSSMSIKEIAERLNFPNQSFLGKYFKERIGISPLAYRKA